jgi:hypothetical protein
MEVTVVRLRRNGFKIPRDNLDAESRERGHLSIHYWHLKDHHEDRVIRELVSKSTPTATCQPIMKLTSPDETQLNGTDMVYVGVDCPQAWWVKAKA